MQRVRSRSLAPPQAPAIPCCKATSVHRKPHACNNAVAPGTTFDVESIVPLFWSATTTAAALPIPSYKYHGNRILNGERMWYLEQPASQDTVLTGNTRDYFMSPACLGGPGIEPMSEKEYYKFICFGRSHVLTMAVTQALASAMRSGTILTYKSMPVKAITQLSMRAQKLCPDVLCFAPQHAKDNSTPDESVCDPLMQDLQHRTVCLILEDKRAASLDFSAPKLDIYTRHAGGQFMHAEWLNVPASVILSAAEQSMPSMTIPVCELTYGTVHQVLPAYDCKQAQQVIANFMREMDPRVKQQWIDSHSLSTALTSSIMAVLAPQDVADVAGKG